VIESGNKRRACRDVRSAQDSYLAGRKGIKANRRKILGFSACSPLAGPVRLAGLGHALLESIKQVQDQRLLGWGGRRLLGDLGLDQGRQLFRREFLALPPGSVCPPTSTPAAGARTPSHFLAKRYSSEADGAAGVARLQGSSAFIPTSSGRGACGMGRLPNSASASPLGWLGPRFV
jgi:hypothetical protein